MTRLSAMILTVWIWLAIIFAGLGLFDPYIDYFARHNTPVITHPCDCTTDTDCMERCGGNGDPAPTR